MEIFDTFAKYFNESFTSDFPQETVDYWDCYWVAKLGFQIFYNLETAKASAERVAKLMPEFLADEPNVLGVRNSMVKRPVVYGRGAKAKEFLVDYLPKSEAWCVHIPEITAEELDDAAVNDRL